MARKNKSSVPPKTKEVKLIPQDLRDKWGSITSIATACNCLDTGYYPHKYATVVRNSIAYLAKLHETLVEDALNHPQAHMIAELKEIKKQINQAKKEAGKNGTTKEEAAAGATVSSVEPDGGDAAINPTPSPGSGSEAHP